ncbi:ATP-binding protein [Rickettsia rickettsii]|uniref:ATP-binding protein n=1 Tax=Rickettsia rickettsii TaxID=783 RepID=UPI00024F9A55|nr:ATP-binding protein [Rickettsia rickettsii]AFB22384.1 Mg chelatase-like protein [Rickettsia rickettsii str. Brazil]USD87169.1 ATP-binding protein [Rickettsia rickettsii]USD88485.1 ATP-binding protein [Rickettsia rickettsii]
MFDPPGNGKSRLAACLPSILTKMSTKEILECSTITSIAGKFLGNTNLTIKCSYKISGKFPVNSSYEFL